MDQWIKIADSLPLLSYSRGYGKVYGDNKIYLPYWNGESSLCYLPLNLETKEWEPYTKSSIVISSGCEPHYYNGKIYHTNEYRELVSWTYNDIHMSISIGHDIWYLDLTSNTWNKIVSPFKERRVFRVFYKGKLYLSEFVYPEIDENDSVRDVYQIQCCDLETHVWSAVGPQYSPDSYYPIHYPYLYPFIQNGVVCHMTNESVWEADRCIHYNRVAMFSTFTNEWSYTARNTTLSESDYIIDGEDWYQPTGTILGVTDSGVFVFHYTGNSYGIWKYSVPGCIKITGMHPGILPRQFSTTVPGTLPYNYGYGIPVVARCARGKFLFDNDASQEFQGVVSHVPSKSMWEFGGPHVDAEFITCTFAVNDGTKDDGLYLFMNHTDSIDVWKYDISNIVFKVTDSRNGQNVEGVLCSQHVPIENEVLTTSDHEHYYTRYTPIIFDYSGEEYVLTIKDRYGNAFTNWSYSLSEKRFNFYGSNIQDLEPFTISYVWGNGAETDAEGKCSLFYETGETLFSFEKVGYYQNTSQIVLIEDGKSYAVEVILDRLDVHITLSETEITRYPRQTAELQATETPPEANTGLYYSSSNPSVAEVESDAYNRCDIFAKQIGHATIYVRTDDFFNSYASCSFNVVAPPIIYVSTPDDLLLIKDNVWATYIQTADIDMVGIEFDPITNFEGIYDGNFYTIKNLTITQSSYYCGMFGQTSRYSIIKNLILENVNISGMFFVGAVVGYSRGSIEQVYVTGAVSGLTYVGGIAGVFDAQYADDSPDDTPVVGINKTEFHGSVALAVGIPPEYMDYAMCFGGLIGIYSGTFNINMKDCCFHGTVLGVMMVGGVISYLAYTNSMLPIGAPSLFGKVFDGAKMERVYSVCTLDYIGDLPKLGTIIGTVAIENPSEADPIYAADSYYDSEISGLSDNDGRGVPKTTLEMKTQDTFTDWDFTNVWGIAETFYPYLRWCHPELPAVGRPSWANKVITWQDVENTETYKVRLFNASGELIDTQVVPKGVQRYDYAQMFDEVLPPGTYSCTVQAWGGKTT